MATEQREAKPRRPALLHAAAGILLFYVGAHAVTIATVPEPTYFGSSMAIGLALVAALGLWARWKPSYWLAMLYLGLHMGVPILFGIALTLMYFTHGGEGETPWGTVALVFIMFAFAALGGFGMWALRRPRVRASFESPPARPTEQRPPEAGQQRNPHHEPEKPVHDILAQFRKHEDA